MCSTHRRRLLTLLALAAACVLYVADRRAVLSGSGHLLFDLNSAEQSFYRVVASWMDVTLWDILADPTRRGQFLRDSQAAGNQVHGTLALSAGLLQMVLRHGADAGTRTLRLVALGVSTTTMLLWMSSRTLAHPRNSFSLLCSTWNQLSRLRVAGADESIWHMPGESDVNICTYLPCLTFSSVLFLVD